MATYKIIIDSGSSGFREDFLVLLIVGQWEISVAMESTI